MNFILENYNIIFIFSIGEKVGIFPTNLDECHSCLSRVNNDSDSTRNYSNNAPKNEFGTLNFLKCIKILVYFDYFYHKTQHSIL